MKRFTESLKWQDPWFRRLSLPAKMLWIYVLDHCDNIGIVEIDLDLVSSDFKEKVKINHLSELGDRLVSIGGLKYFIPKFIKFQYGKLSESCPAHKKVIQAVEDHGLFHDSLGYHYPNATLLSRDEIPYRIGRGKEEDKDKEEKREELPFDSSEFREAWDEWKQHRKEKKSPLTPASIKQQFKSMKEMGEKRAIAALFASIKNGWSGLFEPKPANGNQPLFKGLQEEIDIPS